MKDGRSYFMFSVHRRVVHLLRAFKKTGGDSLWTLEQID